jgi:hypothetical protein
LSNSYRGHEPIFENLAGQVQTFPLIVGEISLRTSNSSGSTGWPEGTFASFIFSAISVWVLLVEILR